MFGISLGEIIVILLVALIVIKPEEIPIYIKMYKNFMAKFSAIRREIKAEIEEGLSLKNYTDEINEQIKTLIGDDGKEYISYKLPEETLNTIKTTNNEN
jgi:Sec-independent protein translocase protein TatA